MPSPFLVVGLPRSRTCWLSKFLTFEGRICKHEPSLRWTTDKSLDLWLKMGDGASDCMMTWLAARAKATCPELRLVVIRRNMAEVMASLDSLGYPKAAYLPDYLARMDRELDRLEDETDAYAVNFAALDSVHVANAIFRHCLGERLPLSWWRRWKDENVQADIPETLRVLKANERGIRAVYEEAHAAAGIPLGEFDFAPARRPGGAGGGGVPRDVPA